MIYNKEKFRINLLEPKNKTDVSVTGPYLCIEELGGCNRRHGGSLSPLLCYECYPKVMGD